MKVVVATAFDRGYAEMAEITLPSLKAYCEKHGYELWIDDDIPSTEKDACKIRIYQDLYRSGNYSPEDVFFWIDTDALVMNSDIRIVGLTEEDWWHYVVGYDVNGLNTGTWFARFSPQASHFLTVAANASAAMGWADQEGLIQTALKAPFHYWVKFIPGKAMNAMPYDLYGWGHWAHKNEINNYEPGDFVLHLPGIEHTKRMELLREYARSAK